MRKTSLPNRCCDRDAWPRAAAPARSPGRTAEIHGAALAHQRNGRSTGPEHHRAAAVSVLVNDGTITALARAGDAAPEGATVIDLAGRTLLPGLIDAHAHVKADFPVPDPGAEPLLGGDHPSPRRRRPARDAAAGHHHRARCRLLWRARGRARQAMRYGAFRGPAAADLRPHHLGDRRREGGSSTACIARRTAPTKSARRCASSCDGGRISSR